MGTMKNKTPFSISPLPNLLYLTPGLQSALHKMRYTIENRCGLTALTGPIGMGKSSILRLIYGEYAAREDCITAMITNPTFNSDFALFKAIAHEFGLPPKISMYVQEQEMKKWLTKQLAEDKNVIVLIDEAQMLNQKMLERVRSMLNIETDSTKLIQVVLSGQIELIKIFDNPKNKALKSRIFAPSTLSPLTLEETKGLIEFRCSAHNVSSPVPDELLPVVYEITAGVPREVLKLCNMAYELMRLAGEKQLTEEILNDASKEYSA